jgi:putative membrane protein
MLTVGAHLWDWSLLSWHVFQVVIYVVLGLGLFGAAFLVIQRFTPFSLRKELEDDQNTAVAIVLGAVFLGIAVILAAAIKS